MSPLTATIAFIITLVILIFILFWVLILLNNCRYSLKNLNMGKSNNFENGPLFNKKEGNFPITISQPEYSPPQYQNNINTSPIPMPIGYEQKVLTSGGNNMRVIKLNNTPQYQTADGSNVLFVVKENEAGNLKKFIVEDPNSKIAESPVVKRLRLKLRDARKRIKKREYDESTTKQEKNMNGIGYDTLPTYKSPKIKDVLDRLNKLEDKEQSKDQSQKEYGYRPTVLVSNSSMDKTNKKILVKENSQQGSTVAKVRYVVPNNTMTIIKQ